MSHPAETALEGLEAGGRPCEVPDSELAVDPDEGRGLPCTGPKFPSAGREEQGRQVIVPPLANTFER